MTLDEFSVRCEEAADAVHKVVEDLYGDDDLPDRLRRALLVAHLKEVLPPDVMREIGFGA